MCNQQVLTGDVVGFVGARLVATRSKLARFVGLGSTWRVGVMLLRKRRGIRWNPDHFDVVVIILQKTRNSRRGHQTSLCLTLGCIKLRTCYNTILEVLRIMCRCDVHAFQTK